MTKFINWLRGWRTIVVAVLLSLAPIWDVVIQIVEALATDPDLPKLIPPAWMPAYSLVVAVVMIWMRVITTTGIGSRK